MSDAWAVIGAWAAEAELAEAEEKEKEQQRAAAEAAATSHGGFPSLGESLTSKPRKKKQHQTFSLAEFTVGRPVTAGSKPRSMLSESRGLTAQEMMMLPRGPRERSREDEYRGGLGGGFPDYRVGADRPDRERDRGFGGAGIERERESTAFPSHAERDEPSRADENNNWAATKKPVSSFARGIHDNDRRGSFMGDRELPSRADNTQNWGSRKKEMAAPPVGRTGRFEDMREEIRHSRADEAHNWAAPKAAQMQAPDGRQAAGYDPFYRQGSADGGRWERREPPPREEPQRRRLVLAPRTRPLSMSPPPASRGHTEVNLQPDGIPISLPPSPPRSRPNPFGSARRREDVVAERNSRPSSSHSSRPDMPEVPREVARRPRPKVNPFGDAKPREVLLEERGQDWRKIDFQLDHLGVDRPETVEELRLKEEIRNLVELGRQEVEVGPMKANGIISDGVDCENVKMRSIREEIQIKERELEHLIRALDDKVRFSQKGGERPGSRSGHGDVGRNFESLERPGSMSGQADIRAYDYFERPGSRSGRGDVGRNFVSLERPGSRSGRAYDYSERPGSRSGRGEGGRSFESIERPWSRTGRVVGGRGYEYLERQGSLTGLDDSGSSVFLERPGSHTGHNEFGRNYEPLERTSVHIEAGQVAEYHQERSGADIWTRSNEESDNDRRGSWVEHNRHNYRVGMRRF